MIRNPAPVGRRRRGAVRVCRCRPPTSQRTCVAGKPPLHRQPHRGRAGCRDRRVVASRNLVPPITPQAVRRENKAPGRQLRWRGALCSRMHPGCCRRAPWPTEPRYLSSPRWARQLGVIAELFSHRCQQVVHDRRSRWVRLVGDRRPGQRRVEPEVVEEYPQPGPVRTIRAIRMDPPGVCQRTEPPLVRATSSELKGLTGSIEESVKHANGWVHLTPLDPRNRRGSDACPRRQRSNGQVGLLTCRFHQHRRIHDESIYATGRHAASKGSKRWKPWWPLKRAIPGLIAKRTAQHPYHHPCLLEDYSIVAGDAATYSELR